MKESFGGIFNLAFLVIFLTIALGFLGLTLSYTKAFKMKNAVISAIEEYEGNICNDGFKNEVIRASKELKYTPPAELQCADGFTPDKSGIFCYKVGNPHKISSRGTKYDYVVFSVVTQFDIYFPIVDKLLNMRFFQVMGDSHEIYVREGWKDPITSSCS